METTHPIAPAPQADAPARRRINLIVLHCSATPSGKPLQQGTPGQRGFKNAVQVIDTWHWERGFARGDAALAAFNPSLGSIGYHFVIDLAGEVYTGRSVDEMGAHAQTYNANSIGICLVGGAELNAQYTAPQWKSLTDVVLWQALVQRIPLAMPSRTGNGVLANGICGHRDLSPDLNNNGIAESREWLKTCPGFEVRAWLANGLQPQGKNIFKG